VKLRGDEMKALDPQRLGMVLSFFLLALFVAAMFVATHMKAGMGVVVPCALGAAFFLLAGLHALYSLTSNPN
jgi:hypothetical protein